MSRMAKGYRVSTGGWKDPFRRTPQPKIITIATIEQQQKNRQVQDDWLRGQGVVWGVAPEDIDLWLNDPDAYRRKMDQQRVFTKLVDREARVAVEGDTDMNHDNVEAAE